MNILRSNFSSLTSRNISPRPWKYISKTMEIYFQEHRFLFFYIKKGYSLQVGIYADE